jgi:hypothetical protein
MKYCLAYFFDTGFNDNMAIRVDKDIEANDCLEKARQEMIQFIKDNPEQTEEYPENFIDAIKVIECSKNLYNAVKNTTRDGETSPDFQINNGIAYHYVNLEVPVFGDSPKPKLYFDIIN